ncbi:PPE family protein [Mycobacterium sp. 21AC1]|uniref:PPE domain-containing protein n=1 Tax=[Mycobacterium] appelbergii TaxID=2939269 RepID=UPI002939329C|nr:PPE domain-containing protein [Mycobacterium sp. 21AC1]MDV3124025.1 PPE family protein [Mycobacterium sp. 21AC1]
MGFTNVAWESRSTEQLARDLTEGPGPASVGGAGAAWVRIANELASVSGDFDKLLARLRTAWDSQTSSAAAQRLEEFGRWLQAISLSAAANGQRAEEAAVANTVAVLAMPSVSEAIEAKTSQDMMASLAAYNGAILTGTFAEFDEAATADQANAAAVMQQYEEAVAGLAQPWEQPVPPQVSAGNALKAEQSGAGEAGEGGGGAAGATPAAMPLSPMFAQNVKSTGDPKTLQKTGFAAHGGAGGGGMGGTPFAPMGAMGARGDQSRDYESVQPAAALDGAGEQGAGASDPGQSWLPATAQNDAPFTVSSVSWGPDTAVFDELAAPEGPTVEGFADEPERTLEQVDSSWVSPPVIGVDRGLSL